MAFESSPSDTIAASAGPFLFARLSRLSTGLVVRKLLDELLNPEIFDTLVEAQVLVERWRQHYNAVRPHSALGYRPPAPETVLPWAGIMAPSHQMVPVRVT